jgi:PAP2 superfamily
MAMVGTFAPFIQFCFIACYVAFVLAKPGRWEWLLVTAAGAALGLGFVRLHAGPWISGLGLAAALWAVIAPLARRKTVRPAIALLVLYPTFASAAVLAINRNGGWVLDRYVLAADGSFGFQLGFLAAKFVLDHPAVQSVCEFFYFGLPVALACLLHTASARRMVQLCLLLAFSALVGYAAFPAVGSQVAFADRFPADPPSTNAAFAAPMFEPGGFARNFMPSLHTAWGLALLLAAWPLGWGWRCALLAYLGPMLLYALGSHYLCDMIVAVPWTLGVWSALAKRWWIGAAYLAIAIAWMLLIRFGLPVLYASPAIPWLLTAATLATPALMSVRPAAAPVMAVPESDQA